MDRDIVRIALRTAKDLDATDEEWQEFIEKLNRRKSICRRWKKMTERLFYREAALEAIARKVIKEYDPSLLAGEPVRSP